MKRILSLTAAAALSLSLMACNSVSPAVANVISNVQALTKLTCSVIPTASAIANILSSGNASLQTAEEIASVICYAVAAQPAPAKLSPGRDKGTIKPAPVYINWVKVDFV